MPNWFLTFTRKVKEEIEYVSSLKISFPTISKWLLISMLVGLVSGSASALFLTTLDWVTSFRVHHSYLIYFLPLAGLMLGMVYHYYGKQSAAGNKLLVETIHLSGPRLPWVMAPLIYVSTLFTHLFGGSAGREGTALQMSASLMDQFSGVLKLDVAERKILLCSAIAAGFGSVFGTTIAGVLFSLELFAKGRLRYHAFFPILASAYLAHWVTTAYGVSHTTYTIYENLGLNWEAITWSMLAGVCFGLCSLLFTHAMHRATSLFNRWIAYPPFRPALGGLILLAMALSFDSKDYLGLGIPVIQSSFEIPLSLSVFFIKIIFTVLTLSSGFKGGEVTPLFFIGATLGSALALFIPLPVSLLAGMGFVAVFAGATNAPWACLLMGVELFGLENGFWMALACFIAFWISGKKSIYPRAEEL